MSSPSLDAAYLPFVATLLAGDFGAPPDGEWPAELVAAHVARKNDLIAEVAERVVTGADVRYDNADAVDEVKLASYAAAAGDLAGLAGEVERSAARLERARDALGDRAGTPVRVIVRDHGEIVQDGPIPIGTVIEGNATADLELRLEQLKSLGLTRETGPPDEFDSYQLVLLERPAAAPELDEESWAGLQRQHLGHFATMRRAGLLMVAGPIRGDEAIAGICLYRAGSTERARALAEDDPAVRAGQFAVRAMGWITPKDAISWP
jgi:uncharacterized protein